MPNEVIASTRSQEESDENQNKQQSSIPRRRRTNLDWLSCAVPPDDLTPFERFTRDVDWANTFFGPVATWNDQLRTAVLQCIADPDPAAVLFGDKQHIIYNEAYTPLVGENHPKLQGAEPRPIFGDLWDEYEANYRICEATGGFVSHPALLTFMTRHGYEEECYFGFKWAPIIGRDGNLAGVYASCSDTTTATILARRVSLSRDIASTIAQDKEFSSLWVSLISGLQKAAIDLPSVMLYSKLAPETSPSRSTTYHLEASVGVRNASTAVPQRISLEDKSIFVAAMQKAIRQRSIVLLREADGQIPSQVLDAFEPRSFNARSKELAFCPIFSGTEAVCFLIAGLGPKKRYNVPYQSFLQRLTDEIIAPKVGSILLTHEKERGRILFQNAEDERTRRLRELEQSELKYRQFAEHAPLGMVRVDTKGNIEYANAAWKAIFDVRPGETPEASWLRTIHPDDHEKMVQFFKDVCRGEGAITIEHRLVKKWDGQRELDHTIPTIPTWLLVTGYLEDQDHVICWMTEISAQKAAVTALNEKMEEAILQRTRQENFIDMISHELRNPMSAVLHCTEDIIRLTQGLLSNKKVDSQSCTVNGCLESARIIMYCIEHQKRIIDDVLTLSKLDADLLEVALVPVQLRKVIRTALHIFDRELSESNIKLNIIEDTSLDNLDVSFVQLDPNRFLQIIINLVTNAIKFTRTSLQREITVRISASRARPEPEDMTFFPSTKPTNEECGSAISAGSSENSLYLLVSVSDTGKGLSDSERHNLFKRFAQASPKTHIEYGGSGLGLFISRQITELMGGQIGIKRDQQIGCTFAFFIQTRRIATDGLREQEHLSSATDSLPLKVSHHPVSPLVSPPSSSLATPRSSGSPKRLAASSCVETNIEATSAIEIMEISLSSPSTTAHSIGSGPSIKVLVVEDNVINQKVVCKQLKSRGFNVHAANHGVEALNALKEATLQAHGDEAQGRYFDIVLCDIEMPVMNGILCAKEIRRLEGEGVLKGHIPILAVTANARSIHCQQAIEAGMDDVTTKPYRMDELIAQIKKHVTRNTFLGQPEAS
ncbi:uncharacterized protein PV09_08592 [Verruconis gallopava]|uniref:Uncharacterized protein n=1 Tax=Verruconis gallopava TaxID=253628 RepID=A0A0D1YG77_9PEZI|nr:uncharacterized protein PV09_08592 [Verruconis gallopava]KIV99786.1 hypothetical protein PV09_08592 [Verruconis gallopava]